MIERSASFSSEPSSSGYPLQAAHRFADLIVMARNRNAKAMTILLSHKLRSYRMTARARFQPSGLEILLEAAQVPDQSIAVALILGEVVRLQIPNLEGIRLFARQHGAPQVAWTQTIDLAANRPPSTNQEISSQIGDLVSVTTLRTAVSLGNLQAMKVLLDRTFAHKHITTQVQTEPENQLDCLTIQLFNAAPADQSTCMTLVCRELIHWKLPVRAGLIRITATQHQLLWSQEIHFSSATERDQQLHQYALGQSRSSSISALQSGQESFSQKTARSHQYPIQSLEASHWKMIAASLLLALFLLSSEQLTFLLSPLLTIVHELGHASLAWLFGYAALPAFDFLYGGGVTMQTTDRVPLLLFGIFVGFVYLCYRYRQRDLTSRFLLGLAIVYCVCASTPLHQLLIVAMGHGFELLFAGIFLYRALSGWGCRHAIERPLYGMLGFFTVFYDLRFSHRLLTDPEVRAIYEAGKGGILDNDFVRLAIDYFHTELSIIVISFLLCTLATPILTYLLFRYRIMMLYLFHKLFL